MKKIVVMNAIVAGQRDIIVPRNTLPELEASRDPYLLQFLRREGGDEESLADAPADPRVSAALDKWFRT